MLNRPLVCAGDAPYTTGRPPPAAGAADSAHDVLRTFATRHRHLFVLTGAGLSTDSGIPCYRDADGRWQHRAPVLARDFAADPAVRRRYWARSMLGWARIATARPNAGHAAVALLETRGRVEQVVTQNVDGLHERAGSARVLALHGSLHEVVCIACGARYSRHEVQAMLQRDNPRWPDSAAASPAAPDGDARAVGDPGEAFRVPACACAGTLKPDVVFFGEGVPQARVERARAALARADAMLVLGSSLMVYSGYRFCEWAASSGKPIAIVTRGRTRADALAAVKIDASCSVALASLQDLP